MLDVCLLGTGGMMPLPHRWLTSLLIRYNGRMILIDCGEGTQIPLKMAEWGFKAIDVILFTHYHADHIAGLPGLLLTLGNSGREEKVTIMGPPGLKKVVEGVTVISPQLPFPLELVELSDSEESEQYKSNIFITSIPVDHTLTCVSYSIEIKRQGKFDVEKAKNLNIPMNYWGRLQKGETIIMEDKVIKPEMVLGESRKGIKICYCTDTRPTEGLVPFVEKADLLICEGMYGHVDDSHKAVEKKHMTFYEAAILAKHGGVDELWLTHYSPALNDPEEYIHDTKAIFANTIAGKDLMTKTIKFQ
ncbi:UNVERIFIED_CONTAM: ribonuclease Z [Acetivibrio alkalicellulosi]